MKKLSMTFGVLLAALLGGTCLCGFAPSPNGEVFISPEDPLCALEQIGGEYGLKDVRENFSLENCVEVAYGKVYRFAGTEKDVRLAVDESGKLLSVTLDDAAAEGETGGLPSLTVNTQQTDFNGDTVDVGVDLTDGVYTLGDPLRNIYVYHAHNGTGQFISDDERYHNTTGVFDEPIAITSYLNMIKVYDFYANGGVGKPFRGVDNSHDTVAGNAKANKESDIRLLIHYGVKEQNAHGWYEKYTNSAMVGVGDGLEDAYFYMLGRAADVMAHEYQHAITHFWVDFVQMNESGAIDEAISDMLGALAEGHELTDERFWQMGEDAVGAKEGGMRSIEAPEGEYRSSFNDLFPACHETHNHNMEGCDFGGVHYNSTVLTHAQYKMWKALPSFYTKEKIGQLWFSVIPLLGKSATFEDFKTALLTTAENLDFTEEALRVMKLSFLDEDIVSTHIVQFCDEDGSLLAEVTVKDGEEAVFPYPLPTKEADEQYEYTFERWSEDVTAVTDDMTVRAVYSETLRSYDVYFLDENGIVLKMETVPYGSAATPPATPPEKKGNAQYEYVFTGWDGDYKRITGETYLTAYFEQKIRSYSVRFLCDGVPKQESTLEYGTQIVPPDDLPEKEGYTFVGWYLDEQCTQKAEPFPTVTGDIDFYAKWTKAEEPTEPEPSEPSEPNEPSGPSEPQTPEEPAGEQSGCGAALSLPLIIFPLLLPLFKKRKE